MPGKDYRPRLHHMLDAMCDIRAIIAEPPDVWQNDRRSRLAPERAFEIIFEASRHLPHDLKSAHPAIPWQKITGIGNILRHEYQRVDPELLGKIGQAGGAAARCGCDWDAAIAGSADHLVAGRTIARAASRRQVP